MKASNVAGMYKVKGQCLCLLSAGGSGKKDTYLKYTTRGQGEKKRTYAAQVLMIKPLNLQAPAYMTLLEAFAGLLSHSSVSVFPLLLPDKMIPTKTKNG